MDHHSHHLPTPCESGGDAPGGDGDAEVVGRNSGRHDSNSGADYGGHDIKGLHDDETTAPGELTTGVGEDVEVEAVVGTDWDVGANAVIHPVQAYNQAIHGLGNNSSYPPVTSAVRRT